jgi:hypothetical protein
VPELLVENVECKRQFLRPLVALYADRRQWRHGGEREREQLAFTTNYTPPRVVEAAGCGGCWYSVADAAVAAALLST